MEDADIIAKIKLKDIVISDNINENKIVGSFISSIWKVEYYQILFKSNNYNDYIIYSQYSWDIGDLVSIIVKKENIKFDIKSSISKYEKKISISNKISLYSLFSIFFVFCSYIYIFLLFYAF